MCITSQIKMCDLLANYLNPNTAKDISITASHTTLSKLLCHCHYKYFVACKRGYRVMND